MDRLAALFFALALTSAAFAQGPSAEWRTIETPHFRVHYPAEYEEWSMRAASRLESIRLAVSKEVGFTPPQKIDVLIGNPVARANGSAWPLLDTPRMIFFTEPPGPDEQLGAFGHWIDLLAVHETAHLVHMLRPTRNPLGRVLEKSVLPFNPITLRAPRWVLEGYATVVEGRLTGAGRPTSTIRALILRRWAENGRLPSYGQLNSDQRFLGMSMAYLMGSAYLEWLEQRSGPESLRNLWSRMTARHRRSFAEAFTGVFGESSERLYGRFVAELTASAVAIDRASTMREGELFQETARAAGDPAVSPDGTQLAVVLRPREQPQKLVIWSTGEAEEEEKKFQERIDRILRRDPEDVAPVRTKPLPRKAVHSLVMPDGGDIESPRWTRDGKAIVFTHRTPDAEGVLHTDLYRWDFDRLTRLTHLADVRDADPLPDGRTAVAIRSRYGAVQLADVDLTTGAVTPRTEPSIDEIVSHPRVSPDGTRIAHVAHRGGSWLLVVNGEEIRLPGDAATPEWISDGELVVTVFTRGFAELYRVDASEAGFTQITRTAGGAFQTAPAKDGRLFFMSLNPDGYVVRVLPSGGEPATLPALDASLVPAIPPAAAPSAWRGESAPVEAGRPYGIGRQELAWLASSTFARQHRSFDLGVRFGDVAGRLNTLLVASLGRDDAPEGAALATAWRGWPVEVHGHLFTTRDGTTDHDSGAELRGLWTRRFPLSRLTVEAGALSSGERLFGSAAFSTRQLFGSTRVEEGLRVEVDDEHTRAVLSAGFRSGSLRVGARYQHDGGGSVTLGGVASTILPRSAYAHRILDPALPAALLAGDEYDGWRVESNLGVLPVTAFYQRHELGAARLSLAGAEFTVDADPFPILKLPGLEMTAGVAHLLDAPLEGETNWWLAVRWRP
ncbi:MAG TPA: hypothetical protein VEK57_06485 [Thermoanaerobaculia bacterium]|nr:hypothetical protein [Thermoanaerobaculia bacterium]